MTCEPPPLVTSPERLAVVGEVAKAIAGSRRRPWIRVGVDGRDGAGKTCFADELAVVLGERGVEVVRASIDRFHQPRVARYRRGRFSPEGFYLDSYDLTALRTLLLDPAGPSGDGRVVLGVWDVERDEPIEREQRTLPAGCVLLVDGIFLHRPELRDVWDVSIYLDVDPATGLARCAARGDGVAGIDAPANRRYVEGQRLYHATCRPTDRATWLIDNRVLEAPRLVSRP